ncbi:hypothetical protein [Paenibacillus solani]|nr:hypothetical protein [Paenibacillus solani]
MATRYMKALQVHLPEGPVLLGGWSLGITCLRVDGSRGSRTGRWKG